ncbi:MAG: hypothetical protein KDD45_00730 [Bdellovibrionales bacterium]|nr:hypothetical protein [Bdellovibrionales bacterium]
MKKTLLSLILVSGLVISCQKSDSNSNTPVVTTPHTYGYNNGTCYDYTANIAVDISICNQQGVYNNNSGYYMNGNNCVSSVNGQVVPPQLCNNNYYNSYNSYNNTGHFDANHNCVNNAGQIINQIYCMNQAYAGQCQGLYIYYYDDNPMFPIYKVYNCWGSNCSGKTLYEYYSRKQVTCQ